MDIIKPKELAQYADLPNPPLGPTEVGQGGWLVADGDCFVFGSSAGLVLACHNSETKKGLLGYFSAISPAAGEIPALANKEPNSTAFELALQIVPKLGTVASNHMWIGGGAEHSGEVNGHARIDRDSIAAMAKSSGIPSEQVMVDWSESESGLFVRLSARTGKLVVQQLAELG